MADTAADLLDRVRVRRSGFRVARRCGLGRERSRSGRFGSAAGFIGQRARRGRPRFASTKVGTFTQALYDQAQKQGWGVINMKNDSKRVFAFEP
jgi:hypothetical protein